MTFSEMYLRMNTNQHIFLNSLLIHLNVIYTKPVNQQSYPYHLHLLSGVKPVL